MDPIVIIQPRLVPLGAGAADIAVRRFLPQHAHRRIGAWCFVDHFGPTPERLRAPAHPHTGLQAFAWLFDGQLRHRDGLGNDRLVQPGEIAVLTAGWGAAHSEYSGPVGRLHGVQLWAALPDERRFTAPGFECRRPAAITVDAQQITVFAGTLGEMAGPVQVHSPLVGAQLDFGAAGELDLDTPADWEFGVLVDSGAVLMDGTDLVAGTLGYRAPGAGRLRLRARPGAADATRALLLGGLPLPAPVITWWNFVGRSHAEMAAWRANWQSGIGLESGGDNAGNFPLPAPTDDDLPVPAPGLPAFRLLARPPHR